MIIIFCLLNLCSSKGDFRANNQHDVKERSYQISVPIIVVDEIISLKSDDYATISASTTQKSPLLSLCNGTFIGSKLSFVCSNNIRIADLNSWSKCELIDCKFIVKYPFGSLFHSATSQVLLHHIDFNEVCTTKSYLSSIVEAYDCETKISLTDSSMNSWIMKKGETFLARGQSSIVSVDGVTFRNMTQAPIYQRSNFSVNKHLKNGFLNDWDIVSCSVVETFNPFYDVISPSARNCGLLSIHNTTFNNCTSAISGEDSCSLESVSLPFHSTLTDTSFSKWINLASTVSAHHNHFGESFRKAAAILNSKCESGHLRLVRCAFVSCGFCVNFYGGRFDAEGCSFVQKELSEGNDSNREKKDEVEFAEERWKLENKVVRQMEREEENTEEDSFTDLSDEDIFEDNPKENKGINMVEVVYPISFYISNTSFCGTYSSFPSYRGLLATQLPRNAKISHSSFSFLASMTRLPSSSSSSSSSSVSSSFSSILPASSCGGGVSIFDSSAPSFTDCSFVSCAAVGQKGSGGGIWIDTSHPHEFYKQVYFVSKYDGDEDDNLGFMPKRNHIEDSEDDFVKRTSSNDHQRRSSYAIEPLLSHQMPFKLSFCLFRNNHAPLVDEQIERGSDVFCSGFDSTEVSTDCFVHCLSNSMEDRVLVENVRVDIEWLKENDEEKEEEEL